MINLDKFFQTIEYDFLTNENAHLVARSLQKFILQKHTDLFLDDLDVQDQVKELSYVCTVEEYEAGDYKKWNEPLPKQQLVEIINAIKEINNHYLEETALILTRTP